MKTEGNYTALEERIVVLLKKWYRVQIHKMTSEDEESFVENTFEAMSELVQDDYDNQDDDDGDPEDGIDDWQSEDD